MRWFLCNFTGIELVAGALALVGFMLSFVCVISHLIGQVGFLCLAIAAGVSRYAPDASAMSTGTAKTPQAVEGRSPASATRQGDAQ